MSQTTATIEEVKQTAHLSNEKAKQVAERASRNEDVAQAGRDSVRVTTQLINGSASRWRQSVRASPA